MRGGLCVQWHEGTKRRRYQLAASTRAEAEAEAIEVYRQKTFASRPKSQTVAEIWADYVKDLGSKPTAKTMGYTGKAVLPHFGAHLPESITKAMCKEYAAKRIEAGKMQGTVWTELGHLQSALNFALERKAPRIWRPQKPETDKRILNAGEARALIDGAYAPHVRLALILLLGTAAHVGAILDLEWDRVDFERGTINLRVTDSQTRKGRAIVPMSPGVRAALSVASKAALSDYVVEFAGS